MAQSIIHEDLNAAGQVTCSIANKSLFMVEWKYALVDCFTALYYRPVNVNAPGAIKRVQNLFYLFSDPRYLRALPWLHTIVRIFKYFRMCIFLISGGTRIQSNSSNREKFGSAHPTPSDGWPAWSVSDSVKPYVWVRRMTASNQTSKIAWASCGDHY